MPITKTETIYHDLGIGWVDEYETLCKGTTDFNCGCGSPIQVSYRKEFKDTKPYEFKIVHRNKQYAYISDNPSEVQVFNRMVKVSTYAKCDFARPSRKPGYFR